MRWTTPTARAEEVYQAGRARRAEAVAKRWPIGPAGIALPFPKLSFRKTVDGALLARLVAAAGAAHRLQQLPPEDVAAAAWSLAKDIEARFPVADMTVLARYGFAASRNRLFVEFAPVGEASEMVLLPAPVAWPARWPGYVARLTDAPALPRETRVPVPANVLPFFRRVVEVRATVRDEIQPAGREPGHFANREKRQPSWGEIEAAWPRFGAWMAYQRNPW